MCKNPARCASSALVRSSRVIEALCGDGKGREEAMAGDLRKNEPKPERAMSGLSPHRRPMSAVAPKSQGRIARCKMKGQHEERDRTQPSRDHTQGDADPPPRVAFPDRQNRDVNVQKANVGTDQ